MRQDVFDGGENSRLRKSGTKGDGPMRVSPKTDRKESGLMKVLRNIDESGSTKSNTNKLRSGLATPQAKGTKPMQKKLCNESGGSIATQSEANSVRPSRAKP